jgi:putative membrane protein
MEWSRALLGWAPDWERNHFDRFVHLGFGLLLTRPVAELLAQVPVVRPWLRWGMAVCAIATLSTLYELLEWMAARVVDPDLGMSFVGAQGDVWDAQKDMALALGGSFAVGVLGWASERLRRRSSARAPS